MQVDVALRQQALDAAAAGEAEFSLDARLRERPALLVEDHRGRRRPSPPSSCGSTGRSCRADATGPARMRSVRASTSHGSARAGQSTPKRRGLMSSTHQVASPSKPPDQPADAASCSERPLTTTSNGSSLRGGRGHNRTTRAEDLGAFGRPAERHHALIARRAAERPAIRPGPADPDRDRGRRERAGRSSARGR